MKRRVFLSAYIMPSVRFLRSARVSESVESVEEAEPERLLDMRGNELVVDEALPVRDCDFRSALPFRSFLVSVVCGRPDDLLGEGTRALPLLGEGNLAPALLGVEGLAFSLPHLPSLSLPLL